MKLDVKAKFDVIIIGSGISGLICALELSKQKKNVCILTKEAVTESSSQYAQGGIAVPLSGFDSIEKHLQDTLKASSNLCNKEIAKEIIQNSITALEKLISYGVKFDSSAENIISQSKEAAHSVSRVCHVGGDATGRYITKALIDRACREPRISISQGTTVLGIIKDDDGNAIGVLAEDVTRDKYAILANDVIVASGGIGQLYQKTTNPKVCTGDGVIMAYRIGAELQDLEMIQFHPTVFQGDGDPLLITEAIRGESGKLKNINGEYFASKYHELGELAPRDILARAILSEMKNTNSSYVYLDLSSFEQNYFKSRFPTVYQFCLEKRIDLFNSGIPVAPAAHYSIGGIRCNLFGETSIKRLWTVGEVSSNGFHGANRLASNSLLECIVIPHQLVKKLLGQGDSKSQNVNFVNIDIDENNYGDDEIKNCICELQYKNMQNLGLIRSDFNLREHLKWLNTTSGKFNIDLLSLNCQAQELKNMLLLSELICKAALERKHSLGVHFRSDFQEPPSDFKHSVFRANKQFFWEKESPQRELVPFLE